MFMIPAPSSIDYPWNRARFTLYFYVFLHLFITLFWLIGGAMPSLTKLLRFSGHGRSSTSHPFKNLHAPPKPTMPIFHTHWSHVSLITPHPIPHELATFMCSLPTHACMATPHSCHSSAHTHPFKPPYLPMHITTLIPMQTLHVCIP